MDEYIKRAKPVVWLDESVNQVKGEEMDRRTALKFMGALVICLGGIAEAAEEITSSKLYFHELDNPVLNYTFHADGIGDLIITQKDKQDIVIPFTEIIEALEK